MRYRPIARQFFVIFALVCFGLGWCGGQNPGNILFKVAPFSATMSWIEGGQVTEHPVQAASAAEWQQAANAAVAELRTQGASMTAVTRTGETSGSIQGVIGGSPETRAVEGDNSEALEEHIAEVKEEIGQAAPFFSIERRSPARFTVTNFSLLLTIYYFLFFLVILPVLGLRERPDRVPDTIAKPVTQGAS
jgi:ubiquinol-cytochrome c reductase cytochrome b subunit